MSARLWKYTTFVLAGSIIIGAVFFLATGDTSDTSCVSQYRFVNPESGCEISEKTLNVVSVLSTKTQQYVNELTAGGDVESVSVFFRDLTTRKWFGVDDKVNYNPGSLFKLPVMISYFKYAELDPTILSRKITYSSKENINLGIEDSNIGVPLESGKEYSVDDLVSKMIIDSDNDAATALVEHIDQSFIERVFLDVGAFTVTSLGIEKNYASAQSYGNIFRMLYNAAYLNRAMSDKALEVLSRAKFADGLVAGVPAGTTISHKFGVKYVRDQQGKIIGTNLHDCGIVYYPDKPYILCVMTKGKTLAEGGQAIAGVSKIVYDEFSKE